MYFKVVRNLTENLDDFEMTAQFMKMVELRQRLFREHKATLLLLDSYDLLSDHVLLYSGRDGNLIGYVRSVPASKCARYEIAFPISALLANRPEYELGLQRFWKLAGDPLHMGYLCFNAAYREELLGVKFIDLMVWIALQISGVAHDQLGFTATLNNRYKQDVPMHLLGDWIEGQPDLDHPVIADKHRVVLVPRIRHGYWEEQRAKFKAVYGALTDGEVDFLRDESKIAA